jgi:type II restriction enzyme
MTGELATTYKSNSQRARVVTESWGEHNLYCPNCSSSKLDRLSHNTQASDFSCPKCHFWFQLKGQKTRIGNSITDGAYESMMRAIRSDSAPSYYFMHYEIVPLNRHIRDKIQQQLKRQPLAKQSG